MSQPNNTWKNLPPMTTKRHGCAAATVRGRLYAVGGIGRNSRDTEERICLDTIEFFDFSKGRWTQSPAIMSQKRNGCAAAAICNSVYVAGGQDGLGFTLYSVEAFDINRGLWRTLPSMSTARWGCGGVAVGDEFMVFGGRDDSYIPLNTAECFNVRTGRWKTLPPMINRRSWCAATVINDKIYIVGGQDENGSNLDTVEVFNLLTRTWTLLPHRMSTRRYVCVAAVVGKYLVVTGGDDGVSRSLNTVEMYDVEAERWMELPSMLTKRICCAAVSLGGSVFVMGGMDVGGDDNHTSSTFLDSVEEMQFSDDVVKGLLVDWSKGSWRNEVAPILHQCTSLIHTLDIDIALMPTLLSRVAEEERVQTIFEMVRGEMGIFEYTCWTTIKNRSSVCCNVS